MNAYENVHFYNKLFKQNNIRPEDIKKIEDINKIPIVRKKVLRTISSNELVSTNYHIQTLKEHRTSGSTGEPWKYYINNVEDEWRKSIYMRANIMCGQKIRDDWVVVTSPHHFGDTTNLQKIMGIFAQKYVSVFDEVKKQIKMISNYRPDVLDGYSGSLYLLAKEVQHSVIKSIRPRIIFGSADFIDSSSKRLIEKAFEAPFYDQFGCGEVDRTAWQCKERDKYHIDVDSVIMQFVDENGDEVSPGETGEIVYTSLFNYAQPFIRYAINDLGEPSADECSCDIKLPLMSVVEGRKDAYIVLPGGRLLSPMGFWSIMRTYNYSDLIDKFQVIQQSENKINIFLKEAPHKIDVDIKETLISHVNTNLNINNMPIELEVYLVDDIPLDKSGKLRSVISHVSKEGLL